MFFVEPPKRELKAVFLIPGVNQLKCGSKILSGLLQVSTVLVHSSAKCQGIAS